MRIAVALFIAICAAVTISAQSLVFGSTATPQPPRVTGQVWKDGSTGLVVRELSGVCVYELTSRQYSSSTLFNVALSVVPKTQLPEGTGCW